MEIFLLNHIYIAWKHLSMQLQHYFSSFSSINRFHVWTEGLLDVSVSNETRESPPNNLTCMGNGAHGSLQRHLAADHQRFGGVPNCQWPWPPNQPSAVWSMHHKVIPKIHIEQMPHIKLNIWDGKIFRLEVLDLQSSWTPWVVTESPSQRWLLIARDGFLSTIYIQVFLHIHWENQT